MGSAGHAGPGYGRPADTLLAGNALDLILIGWAGVYLGFAFLVFAFVTLIVNTVTSFNKNGEIEFFQ